MEGAGDRAAVAAGRGRGMTRPLFAVYDRLGHLVREALKFGVVGLVALVVDVGVFNLVRYAGGDGPLHDKPLTAKTISVVVATTVAYFGNRYWTFRHRGRSGLGREYVLFFVLNGVGLGIALGCLAFSHYVLNLTGPLADNISANVVGLGLGTLFRFWSYRRFVFLEVAEDLVPDETESTAPAS
ncbi:MAG TPA: GtrA family protein [Motilibacteraceae bacterium]|nr:GtrA family protein [Motilibacteraceae bacterium]